MQASTVASESAFSTGGRVVDPYRSRLDPEIVEALVCTRDWILAAKKVNNQNKLLWFLFQLSFTYNSLIGLLLFFRYKKGFFNCF